MFSTLSLLCGVGLLIVGVINFFKNVLGDRWCHDDCFGPYLFWNNQDEDFFGDSNAKFRKTFTLMPKPFGENFAVFFLAFLTIAAHFKTSHNHDMFVSGFIPLSAWLMFIAFFAAFPLSGGIGIVVGFLCIATAAVGIFCAVVLKSHPQEATFGYALDSTRSFGGWCNCRLPDSFFKVVNFLVYALVLLGVLNNFLHVIKNEFHHWCSDSHSAQNKQCVGPLLIWPHDVLDSVNIDKWGSVFSLDINRALELWTPLVFLLIFGTLSAGMKSWLSTSVFLILFAVFGVFGFTGNLGIVIGMGLVIAAFLSFFVALFCGEEIKAPGHSYSLMHGSV